MVLFTIAVILIIAIIILLHNMRDNPKKSNPIIPHLINTPHGYVIQVEKFNWNVVIRNEEFMVENWNETFFDRSEVKDMLYRFTLSHNCPCLVEGDLVYTNSITMPLEHWDVNVQKDYWEAIKNRLKDYHYMNQGVIDSKFYIESSINLINISGRKFSKVFSTGFIEISPYDRDVMMKSMELRFNKNIEKLEKIHREMINIPKII